MPKSLTFFVLIIFQSAVLFSQAFDEPEPITYEDHLADIEDITRMIASSPNNVNLYYHRGNAYLGIGDYGKAITDYNEAIRCSPNEAIFYYHRGLAYLRGRNQNNAIADFTTVLRLDANYYLSDEVLALFSQIAERGSNIVRIEGGTFLMGSPANEPERITNEGPQHRVTVNTFYMGKFQVTQKEYQQVMGRNPSSTRGENLPVDNVSWYDAIEYCNALSRMERLTPAYTIEERSDPNNRNEWDEIRLWVTWNRNANGYRLPTEAEWEYACRAGTTTPFSTGNNITTSQANYHGGYPYNNRARTWFRNKITAVGSFLPNQWELYETHGNVWEWCWDWFGNYSRDAQNNPVGASSGVYRVARGGSYDSPAFALRSSVRSYIAPMQNTSALGFRIVRSGI